MLSFCIAFSAFLLGARGFLPGGFPLAQNISITGLAAKILGSACILLGLFFVVDGFFDFTGISSTLMSYYLRQR